MPAPSRLAAAAVVLFALFGALPMMAMAESPQPGSAAVAPAASPCPRSLKFAGALYFDADTSVPAGEVGPQLGETDPNPAQCALPDRLKVYRHNRHNSVDEVVYYLNPRTPELFRSGGQTGFPGSGLVRWLVLVLVVGIILFAAVPAILAHLRQPPMAVGRGDTDWMQDVESEAVEADPQDREGGQAP